MIKYHNTIVEAIGSIKHWLASRSVSFFFVSSMAGPIWRKDNPLGPWAHQQRYPLTWHRQSLDPLFKIYISVSFLRRHWYLAEIYSITVIISNWVSLGQNNYKKLRLSQTLSSSFFAVLNKCCILWTMYINYCTWIWIRFW